MNVSTHSDEPALPVASDYYRAILSRGGPAGSRLESREGVVEADLSTPAINERLNYTKKQWKKVIKTHLGDRSDLHQLVDRIVEEAKKPLHLVGDKEEAALTNAEHLTQLESIVRLDGSRPSFMVRNDEPDLTTSPVGDWEGSLVASRAQLRETLRCVGRVDFSTKKKQGGTGFLVAPNLLMTNRHVLDLVAARSAGGQWTFTSQACVDFGYEWKTERSVNRRMFKRVAFAARPLNPLMDHADTDLALIELEPTNSPTFLPIRQTDEWALAGAFVYVLGYPGDPGLPSAKSGVTLPLLEQLFDSTYGYKRLAPGALLTPADFVPSPRPAPWPTMPQRSVATRGR